MANPLPATFTFLVALNNATLDDPAAITTVASPAGTLGAANVWTDISMFVTGQASWERGRQHETDRFEAGHGQLTLVNFDGRFNPWNTAGPYYNLLTVGKPFQIRVTPPGGSTYKAFTGHTKTWTVLWPNQVSSMAQLEVTDAFAMFALLPLMSTAYAAQVVADGATTYYKFNEPAGSLTPWDYSSSHAHTPLIGIGDELIKYGQTAGPIMLTNDTAADFGSYQTAGGQSFISLTGNGTAFSGNQSWTVEAWVNTSAGGYVAAQNLNNTTNAWFIRCGTANYSAANFPWTSVEAVIWDSSGQAWTAFHTLNVADGQWHHIVLSYNASTIQISLWLDGITIPSSRFVMATGHNLNLSSSAAFLIGSQGSGALAPGGIKIGHVSYYNSVLSDAQIVNHLNLGAGFAEGSSDTQLGTALDFIGWPAGARNLDTGSSVCAQNTANLTKTAALSYMQQVEQTEDGALFMTGDGKVRFIARNSLITNTSSNTSQVTFGDAGGAQLVFEPGPQLARDDLDLWNQAVVQRPGGIAQVSNAASSQTSFGLHSLQETSTLHVTDADCTQHAAWLTAHLAQPLDRLREIIIRPVDDTNLPAAILARELMDRVTVNRQKMPGSAFTQDSLIEKISHTVDFTASEWVVKLGLSPTDAILGWWILGDATKGVLGSTTKTGM